MTIYSICGLATTFFFKRDRSDPMASCCASSAATIPRSLAFSSQWNQKQNSIQNKCKTPEIMVLKKMSYHGISDSSPSFTVFHHVCSLFFCTGFRSFSRFETRMTTSLPKKRGPAYLHHKLPQVHHSSHNKTASTNPEMESPSSTR